MTRGKRMRSEWAPLTAWGTPPAANLVSLEKPRLICAWETLSGEAVGSGQAVFLTIRVSMALFSLSSSQQLRDLLRQNNVAYSSDDLLIIYQAPLESRSPGAQMKNSRQHVLTRS